MGNEDKRYRLRVIIGGSETQNFYATGATKYAYARVSAMKALTSRKPDRNHVPDRIDVEEQVRVLSGNKARWNLIGTIEYDDIPQDEREWVKLEKKLRDAKKAVDEPVKPPLGLMPRKLWEEQRLIALAQAMERYRSANLPTPDVWHEELNELTQRATLCPTCRQAAVVCGAIRDFGQRTLHCMNTKVIQFKTARFEYDIHTLDAILDATPMDANKMRTLDNLDLIDALITRAMTRKLKLEFTNGERTLDLETAMRLRHERGLDIR